MMGAICAFGLERVCMFVTGQFGYVYKGFLKLDEVKEDVEVAVKTLKNWSGEYHPQNTFTVSFT